MYRYQRFVYGVGALFVAVGVGQFALGLASGWSLLEATVDFALTATAGALLLYVGSWLSAEELDADLVSRIGGWSLGGVGTMSTLLALRAMDPDVTATLATRTRLEALAIGAVAGTAIGIHEARAITRTRRLEARNDELHEMRRTLERRNEELEGTRRDLEHAVARLEASNDRLDHFAGVASHDLREPLRMVSSYLQLLERRAGDDLDDDATEFLAIAVDATERMRTLLADLLEFSRVEARSEWYESVDLAAVLADVQTDLQVRIDECDAAITAGALPHVRGERSQLRQVLQNLLANAIEYSPDSPRIEVAAEPRGEEWIVSVRDEGEGIDPDDQERIFEAFESLHAREYSGTDATSDDGPRSGSGIGLALCRRVVEHHGGRIWVDSEPGVGSTFSFTVPSVDPCASERADAVDDGASERVADPGRRPTRRAGI